jgi:hypothetical protein
MRSIILATVLVGLAPVSFAQSYPPGSTASPGPTSGTSYYPGGPTTPSSRTAMNSQPDSENCGTPDEPKACPPMPRRPLQTYPANRQ